MVLNWLEAVQMINHREAVLGKDQWTGTEWRWTFAERAYDFYQIAHEGWDERLCGGGMVWSPVRIPSLSSPSLSASPCIHLTG